jgi:two-component system chemotaxis response regulator CheB
MTNEKKIRVLIVEDTLVGQTLLKGILADDPRFEVAGVAGNGKQAVEFAAKLNPDVVSMDIYMPLMDGIEATRMIMQQTPVPIVIVSSFYAPSEIKMSFSILEAGALTILPRPFGPGHAQYIQTARNYRNTLRMMAEVKVAVRRTGTVRNRTTPGDGHNQPLQSKLSSSSPLLRSKIIAIGASAGGPLAIQVILRGLPKNIPVPVLIVQHIDPNFAEGYCEWLGSGSNLPVHIASNGEVMLPGHVYLPPGDHHLGVQREGIISVSQSPAEQGLRPAVSFLFKRVKEYYPGNSICILLSGMGADGATELKALKDAGSFTIAQDVQSALVHGMPGEAIRIGGASAILSPEEIVQKIADIFKTTK